MTTISSTASSSSASVSLSVYQIDAGRKPRFGGGEAERRGDGAPLLLNAMTEALRSLGWTAPPAATEPAATADAPAARDATATPQAEEASKALPEALAGFAEALAQALRDAAPGRRRGGDGDGDRGEHRRHHHHEHRGHGWGRQGAGLVARIELVIGRVQAAQPATPTEAAPTAATTAPAATSVTEPAATEPTPTPTETAPAAPAEAPAATPVADETTAPAHVAVPVKTDTTTASLTDAFTHLLDSLRDSGAPISSDGVPRDLLIGFLDKLADGLRPAGGSVSMTGLFIRITA